MRPAVVLSTVDYQQQHLDVLLGLITSKKPNPVTNTDCELMEWRAAGLHSPSWFRLYIITLEQHSVRGIGKLSAADWQNVKSCMQTGLAAS
jgi:hypothetical protein